MPTRAPMKLLHVYAPGVGGIERVVEGLTIGHQRAGHAVSVAALHLGDGVASPAIDRMKAAGVAIHPVAITARGYRHEWRSIARICRAVGPDVVHTHGVRTDVIGGTAAHRQGFAVLTTLHGRTGGGLKWRLMEWLQYGLIRQFEAVVAVSQPQVEYLKQRGVPAGRIHLLLNSWVPAADAVARDDARRALNARPGIPLVGWVGRLSHEKGPDLLVDAIAKLGDVRLQVAVLGDGGDAVRVQDQARKLGVDDRIHWHGVVPDAGRMFQAFDVFVLSSRTEGTPIALFEAMAARVPIVATRVGGVPAVVSDNEALVVPPEDTTALAQAIRTVLHEPEAAGQRAGRAHARLVSVFDAEAWLDRYAQLYRQISVAPKGDRARA